MRGDNRLIISLRKIHDMFFKISITVIYFTINITTPIGGFIYFQKY